MKMDGLIYLKDIDVFEELSKKELGATESFRICKNLSRGEIVAEPGSCEGKVYIIDQGQIRLYQLAEDGREQTLDILPRGSIFGDLSLNSLDKSNCVFAAAEHDGSCVCIMSKNDFYHILLLKPKLALKIISDLAGRLSYVQEKITKIALFDAKVRLLSELVRLGRSFGEEDEKTIKIKRRFTHEQLANLIGATRETVTKTIKAINRDCSDCVAWDKDHHFVLNKNKVLKVLKVTQPL